MSWMKHSRRGGRPMPPPEHENGIVTAISNNDRGWLATLLRMGADVNAPHRGTLPLHFAARRGAFDIVDQLMAHGANIDTQRDDGKTALMIAAAEGEGKDIAALLLRGANPDAADKNGDTALHHAVRALRFDHLLRLVRAGGNPDAGNHKGETPRQLCAAEGRHALSLLEQAEKDHARTCAAQKATLQQAVAVLPPLQLKPRTASPRP